MSSHRAHLGSLRAEAGTNAGLWLDKCLADVGDRGPGRQAHFEQLASIFVPSAYQRSFARWKRSVGALGPCTRTAEAKVTGRMVVGLGAESVLEVSLALHRTYGMPYIPGSALKGAAAAAAHLRLDDTRWKKVQDDGTMGASHRILFGDQESSGYVTFHDALWIPEGDHLPFDLDVMTVHHPEYYLGAGDVPPADWDSPNPVAFVTVRGRYLLAVTGPDNTWADAAMQILKGALEEDGIGAKTAAGYGRMAVDGQSRSSSTSPSTNWKPRLQGLGWGNAELTVTRLLADLQGDARREAASAAIEALGGMREVRKSRAKAWVQALLAAAE